MYQFCIMNDGIEKDQQIDEQTHAQKEVVLLIAGCANSVAVYSMLDERSLPDYLHTNGYDVWCMDLRGHGESEPAANDRRWDIGTYAFIDANTVIEYICTQIGAPSVHLIGHSMGGMIAMALNAHPVMHKRVASVTALGSSIFLGNSLCRLLDPWLPLLRLTSGIDLPLATELFGKFWNSCRNDDPSCGNNGNGSCSAEDVMASHLNTGSARTYDFMQTMFCFEPVGVFEDFSVGLLEHGLRLKLRNEPRTLSDPVTVTVEVESGGEEGEIVIVTTGGTLTTDNYGKSLTRRKAENFVTRFATLAHPKTISLK